MIAGYDPKVARGVQEQLSKLDQILEFLADAPEDEECRNAQEHLQSARTYLLGAMPEEFELSLQMAEEAVSAIRRRAVRIRAEGLLREVGEARPVPLM
jgi:hypothetical protein